MERLLIAIALIAIIVFPNSAMASEESALYKTGQVRDGFTVSQTSRIESLDADVLKFTHDRTGARVIFVKNDDKNLGFSICFHTEPSDDTGMLHILEHAVCAASEKYPGRDVFFDAISQAYITGLNAWTALSATNYFATSMDENQLLVLADFYLDCAFNSALKTQPNYFYREGWRYEMPTLDSDLTINGIVYNEMQGVYGDISNAAAANLTRALFPDTYQSRDSGGDPVKIPDLSYDELMDFYVSCYSPANSVTMFYGDVDVERSLAFLNDGYFSKVDPGVKAAVSQAQKPFDKPAYSVCDFPVSESSEDTGSYIYYSTALGEDDSADYTNYAICDIVTDMLSDNSSALMQSLNASGIGSDYGVYATNIGTQLTLNFYASDADPKRDEEFKQIVLTKLAEMIDSGFSDDMLRSLFARKEMELRLRRNSGSVAEDLFESLTWIQEMGNDAPLDAASWFKKADEMCVNGYAEGKMKAWVIDNPHAALVSTVPAVGLLERNERALADKLAAIKAAMSDEEKQAIVDRTAAFSDWVLQETPKETIKKVSVVDPETVEVEWPEYKIKNIGIDGLAEVMTAESSMDMTAIKLMFDLGHLTDEELCRLKMLSYIVGASTQGCSQEQITVRMSRLMNSFRADVLTLQLKDGYIPVYRLSWFAPNESVADSIDLAFEMITSTDIMSNGELLARYIDSKISDYRTPETVNAGLRYLATASMNAGSGLMNKLAGLNYLRELNSASKAYAADASGFIDSLALLREKALKREGALIMIVGSDAETAVSKIAEKLGELKKSDYETLPRDDLADAKNTAIIGSTQASYSVRGVVLDDPLKDVTGDKLVLNQLLRGEYLLPALRFQMGAYNVGISLSNDGYWITNYYRGGTVFDADKVITDMGEYIDGLSIKQEQLNSYKLPTISSLLTPQGELNDALEEMRGRLYGFTREKRLELVAEIRNTTVEDIKALSPVLKDMLAQSGLAVITTKGELSGHESDFDAIEQMP